MTKRVSNISLWMLWASCATLLALFASLCAVSAAAQTANPATGVIRVGPSVHVSAALPSDPQYEVEISANPQNASELIACTMIFPNNSPTTDVVTYASADGGKTWKLVLRTKSPDGHSSWDPDCQYGPDNVAYSLSEGLKPKFPPFDSYDRIDRSTDGGQTWKTHYLAVHGERSFLTVDQRPGPRHGWLYLYGAGNDMKHLNDVRVDYSPDGGKTVFTQMVSVGKGMDAVGFGRGVLLSDGTLLFPVGEFKPPAKDIRIMRPGFLKIVRAKFVRPNWPLETKVTTLAPWFIDREPNGSYLPMLAVDSTKGPFHDRIYASWESLSSGRSRVMFSYSKDKGKTWSHPRAIDDDIARVVDGKIKGPDDIHGTVAVNDQGVVGVMWLDRRDHPGDLGWSVRFRASLDGGETFLPSVSASNVNYEPGRGGRVPLFGNEDESLFLKEPPSTHTLAIGWFTFMGGHTMGLTADADGRFHPLWVANPTGIPQLWTTSITVKGKAEKNGSPNLASLKDANKFVRLIFLDRYYNLKTHALDFELQLENVGKATLRGPLKVRVLSAGSSVGTVTVPQAGTERSVEGTVWNFTPLVPGGVFKPGDKTKPLRIRLTVRGIDPFFLSFSHFASGETPLAILTTKVLAGTIEQPKKQAAEAAK